MSTFLEVLFSFALFSRLVGSLRLPQLWGHMPKAIGKEADLTWQDF